MKTMKLRLVSCLKTKLYDSKDTWVHTLTHIKSKCRCNNSLKGSCFSKISLVKGLSKLIDLISNSIRNSNRMKRLRNHNKGQCGQVNNKSNSLMNRHIRCGLPLILIQFLKCEISHQDQIKTQSKVCGQVPNAKASISHNMIAGIEWLN